MENLEIRDVNSENADDLIGLCIPPDRKDDPLFKEGMKAKKKWASYVIEKHGGIAKLAYSDSRPVGLIQYRPNTEERVIEIDCVFVPEKEHLRKGIGRSLLKAVMEEVKKPKPVFGNDIPLALVTYAFQVPGWYPQNEFYQKMGFKRAREDDPFLLYYPLKKGYVHAPKEEEYIAQEEDKGKALIFYSPKCPWSIYFSEKIRESVTEVAPDISIRMIDTFREPEEVKNRGKPQSCAVNGRPIVAFYTDKENFQREVREALEATGP